MTLSELKKLFKTTKVESWIEAGNDIIAIGDKMIKRGDSFSRLDYYANDNSLQFCTEKECAVPCGQITFNNGDTIYYNIIRSVK